jgi:hypothetical protein
MAMTATNVGSTIVIAVTGRIASVVGAGFAAVAVAAALASSIEQQQLALIVGAVGACCALADFAGQQHDARATLSWAQRYIANAWPPPNATAIANTTKVVARRISRRFMTPA